MGRLELKNVRVSTIQPIEKTHHAASLAPSLFDLSFLDIYIPIIFFYKSKELSNADELIGTMKDSLSKVLVPFYPFAGRWVKTYDARIRELQCTDEGVPFIEASVDEDLDSVLNNGNFQTTPELGGFQLLGLDPVACYQEVDSPLPPVFVQVTKFKCNGVTVNVSMAHTTADGHGMLLFLKAWSEFALNGETSIIPDHDRSQILPRETFMEFVAAEMGTPPANDAAQAKPSESVHSNGVVPEADPGAAYKLRLLEPLGNRLFHVKREAIAELRNKAAEEKTHVTTIDLISAHLWQSVTGLVDHDTYPLSAMSTNVNGRSRFHDPPLSDHYTGNAMVTAGTPPVPSKELCSGGHTKAASVVHSTVKGVNATTWKDCLLQGYKVAALPELPFCNFGVSSWHRFPTYEISFGRGYGNPFFVCLNISSWFIPQGIGFIFPPAPSRSEDSVACVQLFIKERDGFAKAAFCDEKLLSIFHSASTL